MSDDLNLDFKLSGVDAARLTVKGLIESFNSAERSVIALALADEKTGASLRAMQDELAKGERSAASYREELARLAAQAPATGAQLVRQAREAAKAQADAARDAAREASKAQADAARQAAEARKADAAALKALGAEVEAEQKRLAKEAEAHRAAAEAVAKHRAEVEKHREAVARFDAGRARTVREDATRSGGSPSALGSLQAFGAVAAGAAAAALAIGTITAAIARSGGEGERHALALARLGASYQRIETATRGTISAEEAYRAQLTLTRSGLRVSGDEMAVIARHAREHRDTHQTAAEATQELSEALRNGEREGLRKYGIAVQDGAQRGTTFVSALRQMRAAAGDAAPAQRTLAEETERTQRSIDESVDAFARLASHLLDLPGIMRSVADGLQSITRDVHDLVDAEERAPSERRQREARIRAQQQYAAEISRAGQTLTELGIGRDDPRRRGLIADPAAFGRLNAEQQQAVADRLAGLNRDLAASRAPQRDLGTLLSTRDTSAVPANARLGGPTAFEARPLSVAELEAEAAGLRARRAAGVTGDAARVAQDRAVAIGRLTAINADVTTQARAAQAAERPRPQPRDSAASAAAADPLGVLRAQIALQKQLADAQRTDAQAQSAMRLADIEGARFAARIEQERVFLDERAAAERTTALQRQIELVASQLDQTREFEARARAVVSSLRAPAQQVQARQLANELAAREAEIVRSMVADRLELQRIEAETARQQRDRIEAQKAERYAAADARDQRYRVGEIAAYGNGAYVADELAVASAARQASRLRAGLQRQSELADMRSAEGQAADLAARRGDAEVARERSMLEERYELQRTFAERIEETHRRQVNSAALMADGVNSAFAQLGSAIATHVEAVVNGQETMGDALKLMLADTLGAIGHEAVVKGAMQLAEAAATLLIAPPLAAQHLAAAGAYAGVAALAIGAGTALASGTQPAAGRRASSGSTAAPSRPLGAGYAANDNGRGASVTNIIVQLGGGVVMGSSRDLGEVLAARLNSPNSGFQLNSGRLRAA